VQLQINEPVNPDFLGNFWLCKAGKQFPVLSVAAYRLISAHTMPAVAELNRSAWVRIYTQLRNSLSIETAEMMIYGKANLPTVRNSKADSLFLSKWQRSPR